MFENALNIICKALNNHLQDNINDDDPVILGNIAFYESGGNAANPGEELQDKIVLTLVNIQREQTLKNTSRAFTNGNKTYYQNSPISANLFILFTATHSNYKDALTRLSQVMAFFQGQHCFTNRNTPLGENGSNNGEDTNQSFRFIIDLYSPSFEEVNHLWATLGGKQMPHVMYKLRLVEIDSEAIQAERSVIQEIEGNTQNL